MGLRRLMRSNSLMNLLAVLSERAKKLVSFFYF